MRKSVSILLVEDDRQWQMAIQTLLAMHPRFQLTAIADHYEAALMAFQHNQPAAILLDWKIKGEPDGLAVGDALLQAGVPAERIILISGSAPASIPAHPFLYVPKSRIAEDLIPLLESVTIN